MDRIMVWETHTRVTTVEADSLEEAIELAKDLSDDAWENEGKDYDAEYT